jgi:citrate synthase
MFPRFVGTGGESVGYVDVTWLLMMDDRPKLEPLNERKARWNAESKDAWKEYRDRADAVNSNMERLRAERIARAAELGPTVKVRKRKRDADGRLEPKPVKVTKRRSKAG